MSKALVLGASGATGRLVVETLLQKNTAVIAIVRSKESLKDLNSTYSGLELVQAGISEMSESDLAQYLNGCDVVVSCLGHNLTLKGMFGHPRQLVTDAMKKVVKAIESLTTEKKYKVILMNTTGNSNRDIPEKPPFSQRLVASLLRLLLPPHVDNENAADFLRTKIGQTNNTIEWVAVRPDGLVDDDQISHYDLHASPTRNAIFNAGKTSRINVAAFMSDLAVMPELWKEWKGKMPVIYNRA